MTLKPLNTILYYIQHYFTFKPKYGCNYQILNINDVGIEIQVTNKTIHGKDTSIIIFILRNWVKQDALLEARTHFIISIFFFLHTSIVCTKLLRKSLSGQFSIDFHVNYTIIGYRIHDQSSTSKLFSATGQHKLSHFLRIIMCMCVCVCVCSRDIVESVLSRVILKPSGQPQSRDKFQSKFTEEK